MATLQETYSTRTEQFITALLASNQSLSHPAAEISRAQATRGLDVFESLHQISKAADEISITACIRALAEHDLQHSCQYRELYRQQNITSRMEQLDSVEQGCLYYLFRLLRVNDPSLSWIDGNDTLRQNGRFELSPHYWAIIVGPDTILRSWAATRLPGLEFLEEYEQRWLTRMKMLMGGDDKVEVNSRLWLSLRLEQWGQAQRGRLMNCCWLRFIHQRVEYLVLLLLV